MSRAGRAAKRAMDVAASGVVLALASPVVAASMVAVRCTMGKPVLFRQPRPGVGGQPFELIKLRTMLTPEQARASADADRLTPLGKWLRATSIDELPTLWNVLRGDMSLVGPRPLLMEYLPLYTPEQARRHEVKPGITGLAQVNGRNSLSWDEKFDMDVSYVERQSLLLDLAILRDTVRTVTRREGISHQGEATMPRFQGRGAG